MASVNGEIDWDASTDVFTAKRALTKAMDEYPSLCSNGFGPYRESRGTDLAAKLERDRLLLRSPNVPQLLSVAWSIDWISRMHSIKSFNKKQSSYTYKHIVEQWRRRRDSKLYYISNGLFIAAAIGTGWEPRIVGPNADFKFSQRSVLGVQMDG